MITKKTVLGPRRSASVGAPFRRTHTDDEHAHTHTHTYTHTKKGVQQPAKAEVTHPTSIFFLFAWGFYIIIISGRFSDRFCLVSLFFGCCC